VDVRASGVPFTSGPRNGRVGRHMAGPDSDPVDLDSMEPLTRDKGIPAPGGHHYVVDSGHGCGTASVSHRLPLSASSIQLGRGGPDRRNLAEGDAPAVGRSLARLIRSLCVFRCGAAPFSGFASRSSGFGCDVRWGAAEM
jgi:hypothetical protein